jgi:hypothetical protein
MGHLLPPVDLLERILDPEWKARKACNGRKWDKKGHSPTVDNLQLLSQAREEAMERELALWNGED